MSDAALIEAMARADAEAQMCDWLLMAESSRETWRAGARVALAAIRAAGYEPVSTSGPEWEAVVGRALAEIRIMFPNDGELPDHERADLVRILRAAILPPETTGDDSGQ